MQSGVKSKSNMNPTSPSETNEVEKGKSIYVGQWDAIKENMGWETLKKGAKVAQSGMSTWNK
jgi:hypothetical protein